MRSGIRRVVRVRTGPWWLVEVCWLAGRLVVTSSSSSSSSLTARYTSAEADLTVKGTVAINNLSFVIFLQ